MAEPNPGFMAQLAMWWEMGCPADSDDAVERHVVYQRWLYRKEVLESVNIGRAPERLRFEDEESRQGPAAASGPRPGHEEGAAAWELRCKKCRRVLATKPYAVPHEPMGETEGPCPHHFVEPLSWMRPILEEGALDGRLTCPNPKCGSSIGRYAWCGFKCTCGEWVCPAFSLQRGKVDEIKAGSGPGGGAGPDPRAALGIRLPPGSGARRENL